ncbi:MAG: kynureninase [Candidatus Rokubacteria bacterium]|nr:kynureninase [Candidatus Rokubacteria bacterium]
MSPAPAVRTDAAYAYVLDQADELARFRAEFVIEEPGLIYLDGNSLGRLPRRSAARLREVVESEWGGRLIRGWGEGWMDAPRRVGAKLARLLGAEADEVVVTDSTSVNLFKLVVAALRARPGRTRIVTDELTFPSDLYVLQGVAGLLGGGHRLEVVRSTDGLTVAREVLAAAVDQDTALVALCHTAFRSGFVYDLPAVTALARRAGALVLWDVSHSVGAMPLGLGAAGADLAVGCTYKYLNGGPGAPAFLYVRRELQEALLSPIWGWLGRRSPFDFEPSYAPAPGIGRFLAGTPPVLSLAAIEPAVDLVLEAGLDGVRAKSVRQTEYLIGLWEAELAPLGFALNSPREAARRGAHVSLGHREGLRINRALVEELGVVGDLRYPDNIRLGLAPLYTSYAEIHEAVARLRRVVVDRLYEKYPTERPAIT